MRGSRLWFDFKKIDPDKEMSLPNWFTFPVDRTHSACFGKTRKFRLHIHLAKDRVIQ